MDSTRQQLLAPTRLGTREEVLSSPGPVPPVPGVYAWYFAGTPGEVPVADCHVIEECHLLYIGISPKRPLTRAMFLPEGR